MKNLFYLLSACLLISLGMHAQKFEQKENTHRLMSYNIHHAEGMDGKIDCERIGNLILNVNPEVVALQEVDSIVPRSNNVDILKILAEQTGMCPTFGYSIIYAGGKYGNGILTKEKPISVKKIDLPGKKEARTALIVELNKYVVVNTHLSLTEKETLESVDIINRAVVNYKKPVFLMGDFNVDPNSKTIAAFKKDWQVLSNVKANTFPSEKPNATIDYVLGYKTNGQTYAIHRANVIDEKIASDHRPLFVDIRLKTDASQIMRTIPYLQNPGETEMTVMWLTNVPCRSWVEYGTDPHNLKRARSFIEGEMVANNKINSIHLDNLTPATKYYYRVVSQEITRYSSYNKEFGDTVKTDIKSFTTWSNRSKDFRVIVFNDIHSNLPMFNKLHGFVSHKDYDLVIFNGDCFDDVEKETDIVNRLQGYTVKYRSDEVPSIFIRGNHETRGEYSPLLWNYLGRMGGRSYSSFSLGDSRFVLLDCGEDKPDNHWVYYDMNDFTQHRQNQAEFLKEEIQSKMFKDAKKRILIHHIPIYGVKKGSYNPCGDLWKPILKKAPFNISINGHTHRYRVLEKNADENNFPVVIGGGNRDESGTVMVLEKKGETLTLEVLNSKGDQLMIREL